MRAAPSHHAQSHGPSHSATFTLHRVLGCSVLVCSCNVCADASHCRLKILRCARISFSQIPLAKCMLRCTLTDLPGPRVAVKGNILHKFISCYSPHLLIAICIRDSRAQGATVHRRCGALGSQRNMEGKAADELHRRLLKELPKHCAVGVHVQLPTTLWFCTCSAKGAFTREECAPQKSSEIFRTFNILTSHAHR